MIYDCVGAICVGAIRDPLKQGLAPEFYRNGKVISVLIETWLWLDHTLTLKDPINSNLARFDHAQTNSKK